MGDQSDEGGEKLTDNDIFGGMTFRVGQRDEAVAFRCPIYEAELGASGVDRADDEGTHLVAVDESGVIRACLRVLASGPRPFESLEYCALDGIGAFPAVVAEISRFVVDPDFRAIRSGRFVHLGMLKLVFEYSAKAGITDLLTLSLPHLNRLYELALFRPVGNPAHHKVWGQVQAMHLNLDSARRHARAAPSRMTTLLFDTRIPSVIV